MLATLLMVVFMPMAAKAAETDIVTGTLGDNNGFAYTYDKTIKTLTVTGEDSGLRGKAHGNQVCSPFYDIDDNIETIIMQDCKVKEFAYRPFSDLTNKKD